MRWLINQILSLVRIPTGQFNEKERGAMPAVLHMLQHPTESFIISESCHVAGYEVKGYFCPISGKGFREEKSDQGRLLRSTPYSRKLTPIAPGRPDHRARVSV